ncbi:MAG: VCBS repeat-containing protein [Planctomycetes bacterium]|nr:VCBS repeat-containing protein [Planctomycetota bacterium]
MSSSPRIRRPTRSPLAVLATYALLAPGLLAAEDETPLFAAHREPFAGLVDLRALDAADMNGDGLHDLVATDDSNAVVVALADGLGGFEPLLGTPTPAYAGTLALGDFDADGVPDVAVPQVDHVGVLFGLGDGSLAAPQLVAGGAQIGDVAVGDLDGDGDSDLAVIRIGTLRLSTHTSDGGGGFVDKSARPLTASPRFVELADLDLDGQLDAVVSHQFTTPDLSLLIGNGDGTLQPAQSITVSAGFGPMALGDFDGNGVIDLVADGSFAITQFLGQGNGTFFTNDLGPDGSALVVGDLDRDGRDDLFSVGAFGSPSDVFLGSTTGLQFAGDVSLGKYSHAALLDVDGDGALDLAVGRPAYELPGVDESVDVLRGLGDGSFVRPRSEGPQDAVQMQLADVDSDGDVDMWTVQLFSPDIETWLNDGSGHYSLASTLPDVAGELTVADVNADGTPDLVSTVQQDVNVALGQGDGSLAVATSFAVDNGQLLQRIAVGDVDGGPVDLVVITSGFGNGFALAYAGHGDGTFESTPVSTTLPGEARDPHLLDLDGDGKTDLVVTAGPIGHRRVQVWRGAGNGHFALASESPIAFAKLSVLLGDLDHDGLTDAVAVEDGQGPTSLVDVYILPGVPGGTLGPAVYETSLDVESIYVPYLGMQLTDVDLDGHLDLVHVSQRHSAVELRRGNGTLGFEPAKQQRFRVDNALWADVADANGDGLPDVFVVTTLFDEVLIFEQQREDAWVGLGRSLGHDVLTLRSEPSLYSTGSLQAGTPVGVSVANGPAFGTAWAILGFLDLSLPFKGGTLVPDPTPPGLVLPLPLDLAGRVDLDFVWPAGAPAGFEIFWQAWLPDPAAPLGWTATNAVSGTTP